MKRKLDKAEVSILKCDLQRHLEAHQIKSPRPPPVRAEFALLGYLIVYGNQAEIYENLKTEQYQYVHNGTDLEPVDIGSWAKEK